MPFFDTPGGARLHHEDRGSGRPVVLVHGWSLSSRAFLPQIDPLAHDHRVIALDLRGHGRSDAPPGGGGGAAAASFGMSDLAADLAALFEHLGLEDALLVGWSLGAQIALEALPAVAPRVTALALLSGTPRFAQTDDWPHGLPARSVEGLATKVRRHREKALVGFFQGMFTPRDLPPGAITGLDAEVRAAAPAPALEALLAGLEILAASDQRHLLASVAVPTLLVHGGGDATCLPAASAYMAERIRGAHLEVWPDLGHAPQLSRPAEMTARLGRFARETA